MQLCILSKGESRPSCFIMFNPSRLQAYTVIQVAESMTSDGLAAITYPIVNFACVNSSVLESAGSVELVVERTGNIEQESFVRYESIDGTATGGEDYEKVSSFGKALPNF